MKRHFQQPISEVIKNRFSARTYSNTKLSSDLENKIFNYISTVEGPFEAKVRFQLIDADQIDQKDGKIGTYGVIRGANTYLAAITEEGEYSLEELGYTLEKIILYLTSLGLGTCWLGGTFKRSGFANLVNLKEKEFLPIITPVGYVENKKRVIDSAIRFLAGSNNRKQWEELFFHKEFQNSLSKEEAGEYKLPLELLRLAPSASNKQPWRVAKGENAWHFFLQKTKGYSKSLGFDIQRIDIGIAMCHFEMALSETGLKGKWSKVKDVNIVGEGPEYIISWIEE